MFGHRTWICLACAYVLMIYASSGRMRDLSNFARQLFGERLSLLMTLGLLLTLSGILVTVRHLLSTRKIPKILPILLAYGITLWWLKIPEERFHLLQYGLLCVLCNKALPENIKGFRRYGLAIMLAMLAGIGDELIQWLRPNRVGDVRDVLINTIAATLAQLLLVVITKRENPVEDNITAIELKRP